MSEISIMPAPACGNLSKLPPELRLEVYETLSTSEKVSLTRTCRLISNEIIPLIDKEGIYDLYVNYPVAERRRTKLPFREHQGECIQNVNILWSLPDIRTEWEYNDVESIIACRWDPTIRRKHCALTIMCDPSKATYMKVFTFEALRTLVVFETVEIRVLPQEWSRAHESRPFRSRAIARAFRGVVRALREQVAPILGQMEEGLDEAGRFARFRPYIDNGDRKEIVALSPVYGI